MDLIDICQGHSSFLLKAIVILSDHMSDELLVVKGSDSMMGFSGLELESVAYLLYFLL
jgi:hypothetical protein